MCFYYIHDFTRIQCHLCKSTAITLATDLVISRLDYCNSLLSSINIKDLNRLQGIFKILFVELFADFVQKHLTSDASTALAIVLVNSRLDYYKSTMFYSKSTYMEKLQLFKSLWSEMLLAPPDLQQ